MTIHTYILLRILYAYYRDGQMDDIEGARTCQVISSLLFSETERVSCFFRFVFLFSVNGIMTKRKYSDQSASISCTSTSI